MLLVYEKCKAVNLSKFKHQTNFSRTSSPVLFALPRRTVRMRHHVPLLSISRRPQFQFSARSSGTAHESWKLGKAIAVVIGVHARESFHILHQGGVDLPVAFFSFSFSSALRWIGRVTSNRQRCKKGKQWSNCKSFVKYVELPAIRRFLLMTMREMSKTCWVGSRKYFWHATGRPKVRDRELSSSESIRNIFGVLAWMTWISRWDVNYRWVPTDKASKNDCERASCDFSALNYASRIITVKDGIVMTKSATHFLNPLIKGNYLWRKEMAKFRTWKS